jgi:hypothetical protein
MNKNEVFRFSVASDMEKERTNKRLETYAQEFAKAAKDQKPAQNN